MTVVDVTFDKTVVDSGYSTELFVERASYWPSSLLAELPKFVLGIVGIEFMVLASRFGDDK